MGEFVVTTIPVEAKADPPKLGILTSGIITDYLGRHYENVTQVTAVNLLDTYRDRTEMLQAMQNSLVKVGIERENTWIDSEHVNELYEEIQQLIDNGHLSAEKVPVMKCSDDCKKVEMLANTERRARSKQYSIQGDDLICRHCHAKIETKDEWTLLMQYPEKLTPPLIYPHILGKDVKAIAESLGGRRYLASRSRNTGLPISLENHDFNIDIDFMLMNYLGVLCRGKDGVILVGSDHVKAIITQFAAVFQARNGTDNPKQMMTVNPYYILDNLEFKNFVESDYMLENDPNILRLLILSSISWSRDCQWNTSFLKYLRKKAGDIDSPENGRATLDKIDDARFALDTIRRSTIQKAVETKNFTGLEGMVISV